MPRQAYRPSQWPQGATPPPKPYRWSYGHDTRAFYDQRARAVGDLTGRTPEQVKRDPQFRRDWAFVRDMWGREERTDRAARDYYAATQLRQGRITRAQYLERIQAGRDMSRVRDRDQALARALHPMTQEQYERILAANAVYRQPGGPYAQALVRLQLRTASSFYAVGDTP